MRKQRFFYVLQYCINLYLLVTKQRYRFGKEDKLKSRKLIERLFTGGKQLNVFPLRAIWLPENEFEQLQVGISVSSRFFKKAVDRNRIKRLMREAYRLQKNDLQLALEKQNIRLSVFFIYNGKDLSEYKIIFDCFSLILKKIIKSVEAKN